MGKIRPILEKKNHPILEKYLNHPILGKRTTVFQRQKFYDIS